MGTDYTTIIAYIAGIIFLYILGRLFLIPMKVILKLIYNALIGGIVLIVINAVGGIFGFHLAVNIFSSLIVGMLGVPGILLLIALKYIFKS
ncbi:MAG: pro-sigmaK processing inhibitor BofA family protein [Acetivibrionales bacterium]